MPEGLLAVLHDLMVLPTEIEWVGFKEANVLRCISVELLLQHISSGLKKQAKFGERARWVLSEA